MYTIKYMLLWDSDCSVRINTHYSESQQEATHWLRKQVEANEAEALRPEGERIIFILLSVSIGEEEVK